MNTFDFIQKYQIWEKRTIYDRLFNNYLDKFKYMMTMEFNHDKLIRQANQYAVKNTNTIWRKQYEIYK